MSASVAAVVALVLLGLFGLIGVGWRAWLQRRRTGSTGIRGIGGRIGSTEWVASLGVVTAQAAAVIGPVLQLRGLLAPVWHVAWIQIAGIVVAVLGIVLMARAQLDMGDSWRIGVDESETTALVRTGLFRWVRNPIYTAMLTFALGIALVAPNLVAILGLVLAVGTAELQVRAVEEPYLLRKHGDAYRGYTASVGRFIPGVGLIR
jgi:protein-S-isoprenylcysteine O-methyltransferase Ste14